MKIPTTSTACQPIAAAQYAWGEFTTNPGSRGPAGAGFGISQLDTASTKVSWSSPSQW